MAVKNELMEKEIVSSLLKEMDCCHIDMKAEHFAVSAQAAEDLLRGEVLRVVTVAHSSIFRMFLQYLNDLDVLDTYLDDEETDELEMQRKDFSEKITLAYLEERLPSLIRLVRKVCGQYQVYARELIERLDSGYDDICENLLQGKHFRSLDHIVTDSGDVHNHSRTTSIIETDAGKIVYKPHDVSIDEKSYELVSTYFSDVMQAPRVCRYDGWGFVEFIVNEPADTPEKAARYIYDLGGMTAVILMMGSSDLHHSNVLARGIYPVIIDYELMMTPGSGVRENTMLHDLRYSLLFSSLMPHRRGDSEMSILFARDEDNISSPLISGKRKCIQDYPEEFFQGFRDTYRRCMAEREALKEFISGMKDTYVRHIYRNTSTYMILRDKIFEPAWLEDPHLEEELFRQLSVAMKRSGSENADEITAAEADAMLRGDIPYMYIRADSCDLYADGKVIYPDFFRQSCIDYVHSRIDHLSEKDLAFEEALLQKAMTRVVRVKKREQEVREPIIARKEITNEALLSHAEDIFREIAEDAVYTPSGGICWFGVNYFLETGMRLFDGGFIEGTAGLAVFFAAIWRATKDQQIRAKAEEFIRYIMDRMEKRVAELEKADVIYPNVENISMADGLTGKLLACYLVSRYMEDDSLMTIIRRMIALLPKADLRFEKQDIFTGLSGLLKMLCRYDAFFAEPGVPELCGRLADMIVSAAGIPYGDGKIWKTLSASWAISGAGHGQSGVASALYMAGKRLGREDLITAAMRGFAFEAEIYSPALGAWPDRRSRERTDDYMTGYCSGAPGIGMNAVLLEYENYEDVLEKALRSTLKEPLLHKDFLCCGNSAMIEFLLITGIKKQREDLIQEARTRMAMVIERAERIGHYSIINRSLEYVYCCSLFYGTSGIGYEMLRLIAPDQTDSLLL